MEKIKVNRETKETQISVELEPVGSGKTEISTTVPFFDHMLQAMAFHGSMNLNIKATGDTEVDDHHLVEDTGLVIGTAFSHYFERVGGVKRFGHAHIPMDESLSTVTIDVCNRPFLVYNVNYPQPYSGKFDMSLFKEFFLAFSNTARINLHINNNYGKNSHHISESIFKAVGKALHIAYTPLSGDQKPMSTKGKI